MAAGVSGPHFGTIIQECEEHSVIPSAVCRTFVLSSALFQSSSTHTFWQKETAQNPWRSKLLQIFSVSSAANLQTLAAIQGKSELAFFTPFQSCPAPTKKTVRKSTFWSTWVRQTRLDEIAVVPVEPREVQTSIQIINVTGKCRACQMWDILKYKGSFVQYFQVSVESVSIQKIMWLNRDLQWLLWGCTCVARFCCPLLHVPSPPSGTYRGRSLQALWIWMVWTVVWSVYRAEFSFCPPSHLLVRVLDEAGSHTSQDGTLLIAFVLQTSMTRICLCRAAGVGLGNAAELCSVWPVMSPSCLQHFWGDVRMTLPAASLSEPIKQRN